MCVDVCIYRARIGLFIGITYKLKGFKSSNTFDSLIFLSIILLLCGDIETNPGPVSSFSNINQHLSIVHYNVQSFYHKQDILFAELQDFDILSFTETWLGDTTSTDDIIFENFNKPFRQDRGTDNYGGILVYVKSNLYAVRRFDIEVPNVECIWIEIHSHNKKILFGTFYRPPNATAVTLSNIETSIGLAIDDNISDVIITGDFNLDLYKPTSSQKVSDLLLQYNLTQLINEPTHFTEHSNSLIDLFLVTSPESIVISGTGEPFLNQNMRFHCPIYCFLNFTKPKSEPYQRLIWQYDKGDYEAFRLNASQCDWDSLFNSDIDIYANNITICLLDLAKKYIPSKTGNHSTF